MKLKLFQIDKFERFLLNRIDKYLIPQRSLTPATFLASHEKLPTTTFPVSEFWKKQINLNS